MGIRTWLASALLLAAIGCGDEDPNNPSRPVGGDDAGEAQCVDNDGDGFGRNCPAGRDCDDEDPASTDECRRCVGATKDCPCRPGTSPVSCEPPVMHVDGGVLVCNEGTRYCRDGQWSDCETLSEYVFIAN